MYAIIGLGNPGEKYKNNRHNVGFMFVEYLFKQFQSSKIKDHNLETKFKTDKYLHSEIAEISTSFLNYKLLTTNYKLILAKPQTFMNKSGEAVKKIISNFKFQISNLIIAHDDLDIPFGKFKIQKGTGPELHNGLESIENYLHFKDYWRIRIGVDARLPENRIDGESYVLNNFLSDEIVSLNTLFPKIITRLADQILNIK